MEYIRIYEGAACCMGFELSRLVSSAPPHPRRVEPLESAYSKYIVTVVRIGRV